MGYVNLLQVLYSDIVDISSIICGKLVMIISTILTSGSHLSTNLGVNAISARQDFNISKNGVPMYRKRYFLDMFTMRCVSVLYPKCNAFGSCTTEKMAITCQGGISSLYDDFAYNLYYEPL